MTAAASPRVAFAGGGTAGHLSPALAVAAAYRAAWPAAHLLFLGSASGFGARLVATHGYRLESLPAAPFFRVAAPARLRAASQLLAGVRHGRRVLRRARVQVVVGFGGYASAGAVLAARSLGLRTAVHESNAAPGLTNRLLGRVVDRVWLGELAAPAAFAGAHAVVTGTPVRREIAALAALPHEPPPRGRLHLLVCGGSEGSPFLNQCAPELARALAERGLAPVVRHLSGARDPAPVQARYGALAVEATVMAHVDDMAAAYRWADLALTSAGAATLAELAVAGLPALLVPLRGAASDHQAANAAAYAAACGAAWVRERDWTPGEVAARVAALVTDVATWTAVSARSRAAARLDAAQAVVAECEALRAAR